MGYTDRRRQEDHDGDSRTRLELLYIKNIFSKFESNTVKQFVYNIVTIYSNITNVK